jgi:hypothetical protein
MRHKARLLGSTLTSQLIPTPRGETTLGDLIADLQDTTKDDAEIVSLVNNLMARGAVKARSHRVSN